MKHYRSSRPKERRRWANIAFTLNPVRLQTIKAWATSPRAIYVSCYIMQMTISFWLEKLMKWHQTLTKFLIWRALKRPGSNLQLPLERLNDNSNRAKLLFLYLGRRSPWRNPNSSTVETWEMPRWRRDSTKNVTDANLYTELLENIQYWKICSIYVHH